VPAPPGVLAKLWDQAKLAVESLSVHLNGILMKNQETGEVNYPVMALAFGLPILIIVMIIVGQMMAPGLVEDENIKQKRSQEKIKQLAKKTQ
jgi:uncharacterized integral membrane protein